MIISEIFQGNWKLKDPTGQRLNIELRWVNCSIPPHQLPQKLFQAFCNTASLESSHQLPCI